MAISSCLLLTAIAASGCRRSTGFFGGTEKNFSRSPVLGRAKREGLMPRTAKRARGQAPKRKIVLLSLRAHLREGVRQKCTAIFCVTLGAWYQSAVRRSRTDEAHGGKELPGHLATPSRPWSRHRYVQAMRDKERGRHLPHP